MRSENQGYPFRLVFLFVESNRADGGGGEMPGTLDSGSGCLDPTPSPKPACARPLRAPGTRLPFRCLRTGAVLPTPPGLGVNPFPPSTLPPLCRHRGSASGCHVSHFAPSPFFSQVVQASREFLGLSPASKRVRARKRPGRKGDPGDQTGRWMDKVGVLSAVISWNSVGEG